MTVADLMSQPVPSHMQLVCSKWPGRSRKPEVASCGQSAGAPHHLLHAASPLGIPRAFAALPHVAGLRLDGAEHWRDAVLPSEFTTDIPASLARAAPARIAGFRAGRYCAATVLRAAGASVLSVPRGDDGAPQWPTGFVGSVTHTATRAFAAVAPASALRSVGIDCEALVDEVTAREIGAGVCPEAHEIVARRAGDALPDRRTLLSLAFSIKESVYKCLNPLVGTFFEFDDVRILAIDARAGRIIMRLHRTLGADFVEGVQFEGTFSVEDGHVYTAMTVRSTGDAAAT